MSKYHAHRFKTDEGWFDSEGEYRRWQELKLLQRAGKIDNLRRQVKYDLLPSQKDKTGRVIERGISYVADFVYWDMETHAQVVEDFKGVKTDGYVIKRKLLLYFHGIRIKEVTACSTKTQKRTKGKRG